MSIVYMKIYIVDKYRNMITYYNLDVVNRIWFFRKLFGNYWANYVS